MLGVKGPRVPSSGRHPADVRPALRCSVHRFGTSAAPECFTRIDIARLDESPGNQDPTSDGDACHIDKGVVQVGYYLHEREVDGKPQFLPDATRPPAPSDVLWGPDSVTKSETNSDVPDSCPQA